MADYISPGVYSKIIDMSEYVRNVGSTIGFIPIICDRGPDNRLVLTNSRDFYHDFGEPNINYAGKEYGQGPYIASSFLKESDSLYVIRCLPDTASYANLILSKEIADSTSDITITSETNINSLDELELQVSDSQDTNLVVFYGIGRGDFYNDFQIKISRPTHAANKSDYKQKTTGKVDFYILDIYKKDAGINTTGNNDYEIIGTYEVSFDYTRLDASGESLFIEDVINKYSNYIKCKANKQLCLDAIADYADFSEYFTTPENLENGNTALFNEAGIISATADLMLTQAYTGTLTSYKNSDEEVFQVLDTDACYFSIVLDGGYPTGTIKNSIVTLAQTRQDCVALIDNGDNITFQDSITTRQDTNNFNSRYVSIYESYNKIDDPYTGRELWISPIYHVAAAVGYNDKVGEVWTAVAGFNRASIYSIKELRFNPLLSQRDQLYLNQINPIVKFSFGYTIFGQLTSQFKPTALQDLNIMREVLYIKRALEQYCKFYIFEQNDSVTWNTIKIEITRFLKEVQNKRGLDYFDVAVGANEYDLKAKRIVCSVVLQPTRTVEQIYLNFYIK